MIRLAEQIEGRRFDWYVAISRGGLVPTCLLAQITGQRNIDTIVVNSYDAKGEKRPFSTTPKDFRHLLGRRVLLIDDLVDSGDTMDIATKYLRTWDTRILETAVVYCKEDSLFEPDYYIEKRPADAWITFPWEINQRMEEYREN